MRKSKKVLTLSLKELEYTAFRLARSLLIYDEPIPDFSTRYPRVLESCLATPFQQFGGRNLYRGLSGKAAALFYLMIKNHPFRNGNKRIAMTALFVFLHKNKKWLKVDTTELYNFAMWVARSPAKLKNDTVRATESFIKEYIIDL